VSHLGDLPECHCEVGVFVVSEDRLTDFRISDDAVGDRLDPLLPEPGPVRVEDRAINAPGPVNRRKVGQEVELREAGQDRVAV
jgi:hypothetical protein